MEKTVSSQLLNGVTWNFLEKVFVKGLMLAIGIILARLLSPSDFGLIGMLSIFIALSNVFIEGGFSKALIQNQNSKDIDFSTAFVINVGVALVIYILMFLTAPWIAGFYHEPTLIGITRIFALNFIIGSFCIVPRTKLIAQVDFKSLAFINTLSTIVSGIVGITMAYMGFGVWSLVGQTICSSFVQILLFSFYTKWRPSVHFSSYSFKRLFGFGSKLMLTGAVSVIVNNISTICIGRIYKSNHLGYYTRAAQFPDVISDTLTDVLGNVTFPVLSKLQEDHNHMIAVYRKTLFFTAMCVFPIMTLLALLARPLVIVLLTEKWLPSVALMQWLFLARMFAPISTINMNILNAVGRSDLYMKLDFSKMPIILLALVITIPISVEAITIGSFCTSFICFFINAYLPGKYFGYGALQQIRDWRFIILSVLLMVLTVFLYLHFVTNVWLQLLGGSLLGGGVYIVCCLVFKMIDADVLKMLKIRK